MRGLLRMQTEIAMRLLAFFFYAHVMFLMWVRQLWIFILFFSANTEGWKDNLKLYKHITKFKWVYMRVELVILSQGGHPPFFDVTHAKFLRKS